MDGARAAAEEALNVRVAAGISMADLPLPVASEFAAMMELISTLESQLEAEMQRGDAWREAALAQQDAAKAARGQLEAAEKAAKKKGFKWGAAVGAGLAVLAAVLI